MTVVKTTYDGFFITKTKNGKIAAYEGFALCPKRIQTMINKGEYKTINCFYMDAISYGYI